MRVGPRTPCAAPRIAELPDDEARAQRLDFSCPLYPSLNTVCLAGVLRHGWLRSAVGHKIVVASGETNLKKCTLELGGKSAMIICKVGDGPRHRRRETAALSLP